MEGLVKPGDVEVGLEGLVLTPEGVASHYHVEHPEQRLVAVGDGSGEEDETGAGAICGKTARDRFPQRLEEPESMGHLADRGGFATGDHQAIDCVQMYRLLDRDRAHTQRFEGVEMLSDVPLEG
jgi:hypothetical protein